MRTKRPSLFDDPEQIAVRLKKDAVPEHTLSDTGVLTINHMQIGALEDLPDDKTARCGRSTEFRPLLSRATLGPARVYPMPIYLSDGSHEPEVNPELVMAIARDHNL